MEVFAGDTGQEAENNYYSHHVKEYVYWGS